MEPVERFEGEEVIRGWIYRIICGSGRSDGLFISTNRIRNDDFWRLEVYIMEFMTAEQEFDDRNWGTCSRQPYSGRYGDGCNDGSLSFFSYEFKTPAIS